MQIPLSRGLSAIIDDDDEGLVTASKWYANPANRPPGLFYAVTAVKGRTVYMHRLIMAAPKGLQVDHINKNGLDNRRANLRLCTQSLNNAAGSNRPNKNGFRGVASQRTGKAQIWCAKIEMGRKTRRSKWTHDPVEAARMYDEMAKELYGPFARLNFPDEGSP